MPGVIAGAERGRPASRRREGHSRWSAGTAMQRVPPTVSRFDGLPSRRARRTGPRRVRIGAGTSAPSAGRAGTGAFRSSNRRTAPSRSAGTAGAFAAGLEPVTPPFYGPVRPKTHPAAGPVRRRLSGRTGDTAGAGTPPGRRCRNAVATDVRIDTRPPWKPDRAGRPGSFVPPSSAPAHETPPLPALPSSGTAPRGRVPCLPRRGGEPA